MKSYRIHQQIGEWITAAEAAALLMLLPLWVPNGYASIGTDKWLLYKKIMPAFMAAGGILFVWRGAAVPLWRRGNAGRDDGGPEFRLTVLDIIMLVYAGSVCASAYFAEVKKTVIGGFQGWHMGLFAQLSFVSIYFMVSRYGRKIKLLLPPVFAVFDVICVLGVLTRLSFDPLNLYPGDLLKEGSHGFLSTVGQSTWFGSYVIMILPVILVLLDEALKEGRAVVRIFLAVSFMLGVAAVIASGSDACLAALFVMFLFFFCRSFREKEAFYRMLGLVFLSLAGIFLQGVLWRIFSERAVNPGEVPMLLLSGPGTPAAAALVLIILILAVRCGFDASCHKWIRTVFLVFLLTVLSLGILYIVLNTNGLLPESMVVIHQYANFHYWWGHFRGAWWRVAAGIISDNMRAGWPRSLFGIGPDNFAYYAAAGYNDLIVRVAGEGHVLACAHNEWLNAFANLGLAGGAAYTAIFAAGLRGAAASENRYKYAPVPAILAYIVYAAFCYQQICAAPVFFMWIGLVSRSCRLMKMHL